MARNKRNCDLESRKKVVELRQGGMTLIDIANLLKVPYNYVQRTCNKFDNFGDVKDLPRQGRPRKTTKTMDRRIFRQARKQPFDSAAEGLTSVHPETVRRRLRSKGLGGHRPASKPLLSEVNRLRSHNQNSSSTILCGFVVWTLGGISPRQVSTHALWSQGADRIAFHLKSEHPEMSRSSNACSTSDGDQPKWSWRSYSTRREN